ncbi:T9SS type B sorting domain-containing protein, partial [uncultured Cytophaga sp.]|uniref:T9SS type B sorting domain-containing protein n=1 Tax=uncultured Cytophaga sp. TaxID=160238 RepID=UPI00260B7E62
FTPNASNVNAKYIPSALDKTTGSTTLTLTTTGNGTCKDYSSNVQITLNPEPTITGSVPADSICIGNTVVATATILNASSIIWKTTGTGSFSTTTGSPTVYTPSASDQANGGVIIYASTVGSNPCKETETYFGITILKSTVAVVNAGFDQIACADAGFFPLNGIIEGAGATGIWTSGTGKGRFYPSPTDLNPTFKPDQSDIDAGGLTITLTPTNAGFCPANPDEMVLTITPPPIVVANASGAIPPLCADTAYIQLDPDFSNALGVEWSTTGTGIFSPSIADKNAIYVPSALDRKKGNIGITLTTTGNGTCNAYSDFFTIRLTPLPTINIGPDKIVCADQLVELLAATTVATGVDWSSSGSGIFVNPTTTLANQYILSDADTTNRVINIFGKSANQGLCKPVYDTLKVTVQPIPVVVASADQAICADAGTILISSKIYNASSINWSTNGSGSFTPNASGNPVTYNISQADAAAGTIKLYATSGSSGICSSRKDSIEVTVSPIPVVTAGAPIICETILGAQLNGVVNGGLLIGSDTWKSTGSGVFAVNNNSVNAKYYPTAADIAAGSVTLTLTASNYGTCKDVTSSATLKIEPLPIANAGQDQYSCINAPVTVSANNTKTGVSYSWTDAGGTEVQAPNSKSHTFIVTSNTSRILLATDGKGCISRDTVNITTFDLPTFSITPNPACYSENLLVQSNPSPQPLVPGIYQWFDTGKIMTGQNKSFLIVPDTGIYNVQFAFANCKAEGQVHVNPVPTVKASDIIACGPGVLTASAIPATATINWSLNGTPAGSGNTINITSATDTSKYTITVTNPATTCTTVDSVYVIGLPKPNMVSIDSTSCVGLKVKLTAVPTNIPNLNQFLQLNYKWKKDGGATFSTDSTIIVSSVGTYKGYLSVDQCKDSSVNVIGFSPYPTSDLPDRYVYCPDNGGSISLNPGAQANTTYKWNNGVTTQINVVSPDLDSIYTVKITNQFNCSISDKTLVYLICKPHIDVPTAFTPGVVGSVDRYFRGYGKYEENYKLMVFNRWGEIIFITTDKYETWDGTYLGEPMPSGTYPWIVTYEGREQYKGPYKQAGSVAIIR